MAQRDARLQTSAPMAPIWYVQPTRAHARILNSGMALIVVQFKIEFVFI